MRSDLSPASGARLGGEQHPSHRAVRLHIERVDGVAGRHVDAVVLRAAEAEVGTALRQANEGERPALWVEDHDAIEVFGLALELKHLAAAEIGRLALQRAVGAPAAPQIAVTVDAEAIERALV